MSEYERLGHMTQINNLDEMIFSTNVFCLPHHGVINESSIITKLRAVSDDSCKSDSGFSLNDVLMVGATIHDDVFSILNRAKTDIIRYAVSRYDVLMNSGSKRTILSKISKLFDPLSCYTYDSFSKNYNAKPLAD